MRNLLGSLAIMAVVASSALAQDAEEPATAAPKSAAQLRLDALLVEKGIAEARRDIRTAEAVTIPDSDTSGTVTAASGAGQAEALALAGRQFRNSAIEILNTLQKPETGRVLFVTAGTALPDTSAAALFSVRLENQIARLVETRGLSDAITTWGVEALQPQYGSVGDAAGIASSVLSYLRSDFSVAGLDIAGMTSEAMVSAVLAVGGPATQRLDTNWIDPVVVLEISEKLNRLEGERALIEGGRVRCLELRADREAALAAAKEPLKPAVRRRYVTVMDQCAQLDAHLTAYNAFVSDLSASGGATLVAVLRQESLARKLAVNDVLLVQVQAVSGSSYTQQNVFAHLGGMPFHVTASSVVNWSRVGPQGVVRAHGGGPVYDGYTRLQDVRQLVNGCTAAERTRSPRQCPIEPTLTWAVPPATP
jgi:hypothetical protein